MTEDVSRAMLAELRWGSTGQQVCPDCGVLDAHYNIRTRRQWRCRHCFRTFSVTSGTPFADHKVGCRPLLLAIFAFVTHQKGLAPLCRLLDVSRSGCYAARARVIRWTTPSPTRGE